MIAWYTDIEQLVNLPHMSSSQRETFIASHTPEDMLDRQRQSGSSSPGLDEDEADEVPYSQINSIEEATPLSPQRAPPGGSFPSETQLDDVAMYDQHSRAGSDITTSEVNAARLSNEDHDLARPETGGTQVSGGSIGDDAAFTAAAVGTGIAAGGIVGGAMLANHKKDDEIEGADGVEEGKPMMADETAGPHDAAAYYAGTATAADEIHEHAPVNGVDESHHITHEFTTTDHVSHPAADIALGSLAGGATAAVVGSAIAHDHNHDAKPSDETTDTTTRTADDVPHGIETKPPVDRDVLPAQLNGVSSSKLTPPPTIRRSKSKKEIIEDAISSSPGNNPDWRITPGSWPETPVLEREELY
jgi:hypothetical protein